MIRAFFLVLLLAACGPTGNTPDAICDREVNDDPNVKFIIMVHAGNPGRAVNDLDDLRYAQAQAKRACLRRLGVQPAGGGGVEPVRQPNSAYRGLL